MRRNRASENKIRFDTKRLSKAKIGIAVSRYHGDITTGMKDGAIKTLRANSVGIENINTVLVPGSFELPLALERMARSKKYDALIAIGCVIKGETDHYYFIASEVSRAVMQIMLRYSLPIGFAILTTDTLKQAEARSRGDGNKGTEAALAALAMIEPER